MSDQNDIPVLTDVCEEVQFPTPPSGPHAWPKPLRERLYTQLTPLVERMVNAAVDHALTELRQELRQQLQADLETQLERALAIALLDKDLFPDD